MTKIAKASSYALLVLVLLLSSCSKPEELDLEYSFQAAIDVDSTAETFDEINFESFDDLNLGFYEGHAFIKLEVENGDRPAAYMITNNDFINRSYRFIKVDSTSQDIIKDKLFSIRKRGDDRSFKYVNPNFRMDLLPHEKATFIIAVTSDGRVLDATPEIMSLEEYTLFINQNIVWSLVFLGAIVVLLILNSYRWRMLKRKIYSYYVFYMFATFLMYLGLEGHIHYLNLDKLYVDHIIFILIRIWVFSLLVYTANFLEIKTVAPRYFYFLKMTLLAVLGGTTVYQFVFFQTSIGQLHYFENVLSFVWLLLILVSIWLSRKERKLELKYYLIPLLGFLLFVAIGLIDGHFQLLPGEPFFYIKTGTILEFIGFTYFIGRLVKVKIRSTATLERELAEYQEALSLAATKSEKDLSSMAQSNSKLDKTELLGIFKLLENSLSTDEEWEDFKVKVGALNPNFYEQLFNKHPDLSKSEIRLLTLIKIGYSQKEIAKILVIEPNSVKKAKSRVRKKLELSSSIELSNYLSRF